MKVGLYFGTFNPIHVGHLIIANYMADRTDLDQVWFIVSPQNPLKDKKTILADYHRLALVNEGIKDNDKLRASDIEFSLPKPSYTINTLTYLKEKYPDHQFSLIMGEDNIRTLHKWKNYERILQNHDIYVYPRIEGRNGESNDLMNTHDSVIYCDDVPLMNISASYIRETIQSGGDVRYLLSEPVFKYLDEMNFYK